MTKELLFFCTLAAGDLGSTKYALNHNTNTIEGNPLMRGSVSKQVLFKSGSCLAEAFVTSKMGKRKKWFYVIGGVIGAGIITNNMIRSQK